MDQFIDELLADLPAAVDEENGDDDHEETEDQEEPTAAEHTWTIGLDENETINMENVVNPFPGKKRGGIQTKKTR